MMRFAVPPEIFMKIVFCLATKIIAGEINTFWNEILQIQNLTFSRQHC